MSKGQRPRNNLNEPDVRSVTVYIYALCEPGTGEIRYVGRSANPPQRLAHHRGKDAARYVHDWIRELEASGATPIIRVLCIVRPGEDAAPHEKRFITALCGERLLNVRGTPRPPAKDGTCRVWRAA